MADFPALPLWTDAYLGDTRHLTRDAHGAYLLLLIEAWRRPRCSLPDDDKLLSKLTCSTPEEWKSLKPIVMAFWKRDGRRREWTQKRLLKEHNYVAELRSKNRDAALSRWNRSPQNLNERENGEKCDEENPCLKGDYRASGPKQTKTEHANAMPPHLHLNPFKKDARARSKKEAGVGPNGSQPTTNDADVQTAVTAMFQTMRREIGEHAYRTWLQPLHVAGSPNGSLTLTAPNKFHADHVAGRYVSRIETIMGALVSVVPAGAPAAPIAPPAVQLPRRVVDHPDRPDFSQVLPPMPTDDDDSSDDRRPLPLRDVPRLTSPAVPSTRRKTSGFTRAEIEAGALDAPQPPGPPPPASPQPEE